MCQRQYHRWVSRWLFWGEAKFGLGISHGMLDQVVLCVLYVSSAVEKLEPKMCNLKSAICNLQSESLPRCKLVSGAVDA